MKGYTFERLKGLEMEEDKFLDYNANLNKTCEKKEGRKQDGRQGVSYNN